MLFLNARLILVVSCIVHAIDFYAETVGWDYVVGSSWDQENPDTLPIAALTPAQACDNLYPQWINDKVRILYTHSDWMPQLLGSGKRHWKYPVIGACYRPSINPKKPKRKGVSLHFRCVDRFWYQVQKRIPWYEKAASVV